MIKTSHESDYMGWFIGVLLYQSKCFCVWWPVYWFLVNASYIFIYCLILLTRKSQHFSKILPFFPHVHGSQLVQSSTLEVPNAIGRLAKLELLDGGIANIIGALGAASGVFPMRFLPCLLSCFYLSCRIQFGCGNHLDSPTLWKCQSRLSSGSTSLNICWGCSIQRF